MILLKLEKQQEHYKILINKLYEMSKNELEMLNDSGITLKKMRSMIWRKQLGFWGKKEFS